MSDLSYTAWDDNQYPWPPPDGWYQASDGKWWPEGYGPPTTTAADDQAGAYDVEPGDAAEASEAPDADTITTDMAASVTAADDSLSSEFSSSHLGSSYHDSSGLESPESAHEPSARSEPVSSGYSSPASDNSGSNSGSSGPATSAEYASSAGYASPGYSPTGEGSPPGLAGWAQSGTTAATDVSDSVGSEVEAVADEADSVVDQASTAADVTVASALNRLDDLQRRVESQDFGVGPGAAAAGSGLAAAGSGLVDSAADEASDVMSDLDVGADPLSEGVEATSGAVSEVPTDLHVTAGSFEESMLEPSTDAFTEAVSDSAGNIIDPSETLDIDPDELSIDTNPYYGDAQGAYPDQNGYQAVADVGPQTGYPQVQGAQADQRMAIDDKYLAPVADYDRSVLTPVSMPPPSSGGKRLLYVVLGLLAMAAAGFAGYVLFQLQGGDGETDTGVGDSGAETAEAEAAESFVGSYSNPHQPDKGVRITVPVGESEQNDWMLEVRELASATNLDDGNVELMTLLRVRNDTPTVALSLDNLRFNLVTSDGGDTIAQSACFGGGDLNRVAIVDPGKTAEGRVCWVVPADQVGSALMAVQSATARGRVHVRIS
ncbi:MAG: hypothetical protein OER95_15570 [Acidimicrobiia bacterium]|nr:hypothetical protein [Acidimicrobiia bacterium]